MPTLPKISVITATFNAEKTLAACLQSVAAQDYRHLEHLIIDNRSTDRTLEIADEHRQKHSHVLIISESDRGIYDAMNKGIKRATSEWIYFLGSDDKLEPGSLKAIFANPGVAGLDVVYGDVRFKETGEIYDGEFTLEKLLEKNVCHQAIFYRRGVFKRLGEFNLRYSFWADWEFNWRCFTAPGLKCAYLTIIVASYSRLGMSSRTEDTNFVEDQHLLILKYFGGLINPDRLHEMVYDRAFDPIRNREYLKGGLFAIRAGIHTRHLRHFIRCGKLPG